jgi:hypothetical protein
VPIVVAVYYSVLSGVWSSALAPAALVNNEINGLILDTMFKAIRQYHTAILLAIIQNVGLPLGFSFGQQESIEVYDHFYTTFRDGFGSISKTRPFVGLGSCSEGDWTEIPVASVWSPPFTSGIE